jgi:hypothetical protein
MVPSILVVGAQHANLDADLRAPDRAGGMPFLMPGHDYYPFAFDDGGRLVSLAVEHVDRLAIVVAAHRVMGTDMGSIDSQFVLEACYPLNEGLL